MLGASPAGNWRSLPAPKLVPLGGFGSHEARSPEGGTPAVSCASRATSSHGFLASKLRPLCFRALCGSTAGNWRSAPGLYRSPGEDSEAVKPGVRRAGPQQFSAPLRKRDWPSFPRRPGMCPASAKAMGERLAGARRHGADSFPIFPHETTGSRSRSRACPWRRDPRRSRQ